MNPIEVRKYLYDIQEACELLDRFTQGKSLDNYVADALLRSAVERPFEIIGEAIKQMLKLNPDLSASISVHQRIIAFRNRLIQGYADIAHDVVWGILESNLPKLRKEIREILTSEEDES